MKTRTIRYRAPLIDGTPMVGTILMGDGTRVRRGYRILGARQSAIGHSAPGLTTWRLAIEAMPKAAAMAEIEGGAPCWSIVWDRRERKCT